MQLNGTARRREDVARQLIGCLRTTRATRILSADAGAARLFQRDVSVLTEKPLVVFVQLSERPLFRSRLALLPLGGHIHDWRLELVTPGGIAIPVAAEVTSHPSVGSNGDDELQWTIMSARAATAAGPVGDFGSDDRLAALELAVGQLGHDIKQPLAAIVSYARGAILRARTGTLTASDLEGVLEIIVAEALRAADRLHDVRGRSGGGA
jgi:signal transduction histidine kinase